MLPGGHDGNPVFRRATPGNLWISCAQSGGKRRFGADNQQHPVDSVWTEKKPEKDTFQVLRGPVRTQ
jgi:hypothetical protein